jgi:TonB family protein
LAGRCFIPVMEPPVREKEPAASYSPTVEELHLLIENLDEEIDHYRRREAAWLSLIVHAVIILAFIFAPRWLPKRASLVPIKTKSNTTFVFDNNDVKPIKPPKTDILSDQNRLAQMRQPAPDKETLRKWRDARRPGAPAAPRPQQQVAQASPEPQPAQPQTAPQQQQPPPQTSQTSQVTTPPQPTQPPKNPFAVASPGSSVNQAIQSVAADHGTGRSYGGDYGVAGPHPKTDRRGAMEIVSDTLGVDFGPYMQRLHVVVQNRWDVLIPQVALPPVMKKGTVVLEFSILKDGTVTGLKVISSSGDEALDRAAYGAILTGKLPQLPPNFTGDYLTLHAHFYYNPDKGDFE